MDKSYTLIITNKFDYCTNAIIKWLKYYNKQFIVIDTNKKVQISKILINTKVSKIELLVDGIKVELEQIKSVFFWKGRMQFALPQIQLKNYSNNFKKEIDRFLKRELDTLTQYIYDDLNKKKIFGLCITKNPNKLRLLSFAKEVGLKIPDTVISSSLELIKHIVKSNNSITKPIQEIFNYREEGKTFATLTQLVDIKKLCVRENVIFPSLIQENIEKKYELRIFYFSDRFYTMAVFSQSDDKTKTDFRDYNYEKPNRMVPYILPDELKRRLKILINKIGYNSCSIDMIVNKRGEYIFLEVNPLGQFDLESMVCNYNIEKKVVKYLIY